MNKKTDLISLNDPAAYEKTAAVIRAGGVVAFPTDTVYGIGVSAFNKKAIEKIYKVKGRSQLKAIPILIGEVEDLDQITSPIPFSIHRIIDTFWPGALTLILPLLPELPDNLSPATTIGLRLPDHDQVRNLLRETGPLAATSANLSGEKSALTADDVLEQLEGRIDLILDGGPVPGGQASTVLDCTQEKLKVLREGPVSLESILRVLDEQN